jgi:cysteine desulfurase
MIYLDHNATTPLSPRAAEAMARCWRGLPCNPSSQHAAGRQARRLLEDAREGLAELLGAVLHGAAPDRLIFTSGGSEANNLALFGLAAAGSTSGPAPPHAIVSAVEHPSVLGPATQLARFGWAIDHLPVDPNGQAMVHRLPDLLRPQTRFVALMLAQNETGVLQPVAEAAAICQRAGVPLHVDAVQAAGKIQIDFRSLGAATMAVAAHKFNGPVGIGALIVRHGVAVAPHMFGGVQEQGLRPGTQAVALAVGMHAALAEWHAERQARQERLAAMRDLFEALLRDGVPNLVVHGCAAPRLPHTSSVALPGVERQAMHLALDRAGVAAATGSACASGASQPSSTLRAMGLPEELVAASLRFSFGPSNTEAEVREACRLIVMLHNELRAEALAGKTEFGRRIRPEHTL